MHSDNLVSLRASTSDKQLHIVEENAHPSVFADDFGQRALVGKVCMDRNNSMKHYRETSQESQDETCR